MIDGCQREAMNGGRKPVKSLIHLAFLRWLA
jgi:hypothetical protein